MTFFTRNPYHHQIISEYQYDNLSGIEAQINLAHDHFKKLQQLTVKERGQLLLAIAQRIEKHKVELAQLITLEMGKPLVEAFAEVDKSIKTFEYYGLYAESFQNILNLKGPYDQNQVILEGIGPILLIMPWNHPLWQITRVLAPTLLVGNSVVLKHSDIVAGFAQRLAELLTNINFKTDELLANEKTYTVLVNVRFEHHMMEQVMAFDKIRAVSVTGSTKAGAELAKAAGRYLKKSVLELGGNDAYFILPDCDLNEAVLSIIQARMINCGQSCIGPKRIFVHRDCYQEVNQIFLQNLSNLSFGDPMKSQTPFDRYKLYEFRYGPLAHSRFCVEIDQKVKKLQSLGAILQLGGEYSSEQKNNFYPVTFLKDVDFSKFDEEIFGPVFCVGVFDDLAKAIDQANQSQFGLAGAIYTLNQSHIDLFISKMQVGNIAVNDFIRTDSRIPFGGLKNSGFGRELGDFGIYEFANIKAVVQTKATK